MKNAAELDEGFVRQLEAVLDDLAPASLYGARLELEAHNWGGRRATWSSDDMRLWQQRMAERGWTAPTWPVEFGGAGWTEAQTEVLRNELRRRRLPPPLVGIGLSMAGPALLAYGTDDQQARLLAPTARGEIRWCQGFSEPDAGSDLPALKTRAVERSGVFVVNGEKVWTSHAHLSDWMFALVRTDPDAPKRQGISCLLVDMSSPGVAARPIPLISGASPFCATSFENVEVPAGNLLGPLNGGWDIARFFLAHERGMLGAIVVGGHKGEPLGSFATRYLDCREGRVVDDGLRRAVATVEMDSEAYHWLTKGAAAQPAEPNVLKLYSSELNQRRLDLRQVIAGLAGMAWEAPGFAEEELRLSRTWLRSRAYSIEGGTSEILLNSIARRTLGLPSEGA